MRSSSRAVSEPVGSLVRTCRQSRWFRTSLTIESRLSKTAFGWPKCLPAMSQEMAVVSPGRRRRTTGSMPQRPDQGGALSRGWGRTHLHRSTEYETDSGCAGVWIRRTKTKVRVYISQLENVYPSRLEQIITFTSSTWAINENPKRCNNRKPKLGYTFPSWKDVHPERLTQKWHALIPHERLVRIENPARIENQSEGVHFPAEKRIP